MNMKLFLSSGLLLATLLTLSALTGCVNEGLEPVFYALEIEQSLTDDRGLEDNITVQRIVKDTVTNRYFAAAGTLYTRTDGNDLDKDRWAAVAPPVPWALCNTVEVFGSPAWMYVGFISKSGTGLGLWRIDPAALGSGWQEITDAAVNDMQIIMLRSLNDGTDRLYVSTKSGSTDSLFHSTNGTAFTSVTINNPPATPTPITDVAWNGVNYWAVLGPTLYWDNVGGLTSLEPYIGGTPAANHRLGALHYSATLGRLFVGSDNGISYSWNGAAWTESSPQKVDDKEVRFTAIAEVTVTTTPPPISPNDIYWGTGGSGFYFFADGLVDAPPARSPAFTVSALYNGAVNSMLYDGAVTPQKPYENLFIGTSGAGLWRGDWVLVDPDKNKWDWQWKQE